jgi:hypothetical protein
MLKMMAIALKYGLPGLITIASEYGVPMAAIAFFVFYPIAHIMLGIALLIFAAFIPRLPGDDTKHIINVGNKLSFKGNARTAPGHCLSSSGRSASGWLRRFTAPYNEAINRSTTSDDDHCPVSSLANLPPAGKETATYFLGSAINSYAASPLSIRLPL